MSMPLGLYRDTDRSPIATILQPSRASNCAATEPTLPKPWIDTVVPFTGMPRCCSASFVTIMQPRPVASRRPSEPPSSTGFPVTTAVVGCPTRIEEVGITPALTPPFLFTSGGGTAEAGADRQRTRLNTRPQLIFHS